MEHELISVIIPVFNKERYIMRCLKSVLNSTYQNLEIILIDDGSTDSSLPLCKQVANTDSRVKVVARSNAGVSAARNAGLMYATGELISFIDPDDYIQRTMFEVLYNTMRKYKVDLVYCGSNILNPDGSIICVRCVGGGGDSVIESESYDLMANDAHLVVWGTLYRKELLRDISFQEGLYVGEDSLYFIQALKKSKKIVSVGQALYNYVLYDQSASHGHFDEKKFTEISSWQHACKLFDKKTLCSVSCKVHLGHVAMYMCQKYKSSVLFDAFYASQVQKVFLQNSLQMIFYYIKKKMYIDALKIALKAAFVRLWYANL